MKIVFSIVVSLGIIALALNMMANAKWEREQILACQKTNPHATCKIGAYPDG